MLFVLCFRLLSFMTFKVDRLSKRNSTRWLLRDISFSAEKGSVFGILGEQFSGKTTFLEILSGKSSSNGGTYGFEESGQNQIRRPRKIGFIGGPTTKRNSFFGIFGGKGDGETATDLKSLVSQLESDFEILLIDNAISQLDEDDKERFARQLRQRCRATGAIAIFATRRFPDITLLCDEATILDGTHQIQTGTPRELYLEPKTVKAAIMTGAVNLFAARRTSSTKVDNPIFRLIDSPHDIVARPTPNADLGPINQNMNLMIRPESVSISFGASFPEDNLLKGLIEEIDFRGPFTYLRMDCDGLKITATVPKVVGLNIGDTCMIGLPPDRIHVLKS